MASAWHADPDVGELRQRVYQQIYTLFQQRKTGGSNWSEKLPDFVKRLEQALFADAASKEDYGNFETLEARLQVVARGLVQRPAAGAAGGVTSTPVQPQPGLSNGSMLPQTLEPSGGGASAGMAPGALGAGSGVLPGAFGGPSPPVQSMGMMPTPNSVMVGASSGYPVKAEAGAPSSSTSCLPNGMVPVDAAGGTGLPPSGYQQPSGMIPVPGLAPQGAMGSSLMSNGAPVLIKQDGMWPATSTSPGMIPTNPTGTMGTGALHGMMPTALQMPGTAPPGFVPSGGGLMPGAGGLMPTPGGGGGMMPTPGAGLMPNPGSTSGLMPTPGMGGNSLMQLPTGGGMVPAPGNGGGGMMPGSMLGGPASGGNAMGMVPIGGLGGQSQQPQVQLQPLHPPQQQALLQPQQQVAQLQPQQQQQLPGSTGGGLMMPVGNSAFGSDGSAGVPVQQSQQPQPGSAGTKPPGSSSSGGGTNPELVKQGLADRQQYIQKQQRWLLFLRHCAKCQQSEEECQFGRSCRVGKDLWTHILSCNSSQCQYPRCTSSKDLLKHHQKCQNAQCPICTPVKEYVKRTRMQASGSAGAPPGGAQQPPGGGAGMLGGTDLLQQQAQAAQAQATQQYHQQQAALLGHKRPMNGMMDPAAAAALPGMVPMGPSSGSGLMAMQQQQYAAAQAQQYAVQQAHAQQYAAVYGAGGYAQQPGGYGVPPGMVPGMMQPMANGYEDPAAAAAKRVRQEPTNQQLLAKNTGTSLLECFDLSQIRTHLDAIVTIAQQTKVPSQLPLNPGDDCKVCGLTKLTFEPPCIYCTQCGQRIKRGQTYHCTLLEPGCEFRGFWCHSCLSEHKGDKIPWEGSQVGMVRKADLQKKKNDDEIEEGWVQCDACESWVHQICGLFNKGKNDQTVHYLCPKCLMLGLESGSRERISVRPQAMLEAKDLPSNNLSQLLEARINSALEQDRQQRAMMQGKSPWEVPTAEGLTVRVVNSVIKKCEVKPRFGDAFKGDGYPEAFIYRQRVILLYQKTDGVDVALYCMYVQEYGPECAPPNRNVVYLSYIDSVKYFRPEVLAACGVSLRTFVYHQILLGYLAFVRGLGYETMLIWACPPLAGDDYILYCHPSKQKTPRSDRLRAWYHDMLRRARDEGSVAHISTLWDSYFEGGRDHRMDRCSVTAIPYLEGDYWPGEAENLLSQIAGGGGGAGNGGNRKAGSNKGKRYGGGAGTTDEQLLGRLGEILGGNMREDFMVVHLQEPCSFCRGHVTGSVLHKYVPTGPGGANVLSKPAPSERRFEGIRLEGGGAAPASGPLQHLQICGDCYSAEATRVASGQKSRLPGGLTLTDLTQITVPPLQLQQDPDADMPSEFFETRQAFLSLCQGNHYQFDSLRRAKHSSMMVLYHLHNPEAPAFSSTCNFCHVEIEPGTGLRCTVCSDFDMCRRCHAAGMQHEHPMVATTNFASRDEMRSRLTEQERIERSQQLQKTLALLVHACSCHNPQCSSTSCRKVRALFQHAVQCQQKVTGGCHLCKKMWCLLNLHAKSCTTSDCPVPRCRELKDLRRRQTAHIEQKRRAAYASMMRNAATAAAK